jgi:hypothetical protein
MFGRAKAGLACDLHYRDSRRLGEVTLAACPRRGEHIFFHNDDGDQEFWVLKVTHLAVNALGYKHPAMIQVSVTDRPEDFTDTALLGEIALRLRDTPGRRD